MKKQTKIEIESAIHYYCPFCGIVFFSQKNTKEHIERKHVQEKINIVFLKPK